MGDQSGSTCFCHVTSTDIGINKKKLNVNLTLKCNF